MIGFDMNLPYWGTHMMDIFEERIWKGEPPQTIFTTEEMYNQVYHDCMEYILSISVDNEHTIDVIKAYIEGNHGYSRDLAKARSMLMSSKNKMADFYLG